MASTAIVQESNDRATRSVFVGNIPYEATEETMKEIFQQVGPVVSFRIVYDRESGKPKGYGFCEYQDTATAESAKRNLNNTDYHGRPLRVGAAAGDQSNAEMKAMQQGLTGPVMENPYGDPVEPEKAPEAISKAVASLPPEQMFELMKQMKLCVQNNPNEARNMLLQNPQLAYALLQAQIVMKIVDPQVAMAMLHRKSDQIPPVMPSQSAPTPPMDTSGPPSRPDPVPTSMPQSHPAPVAPLSGLGGPGMQARGLLGDRPAPRGRDMGPPRDYDARMEMGGAPGPPRDTDIRQRDMGGPPRDIDARLGGPMPRDMGGPKQRDMGGPMPRDMGGPMQREMGGPMPREMGGPMQREMGGPMQREMGGPMQREMGGPVQRDVPGGGPHRGPREMPGPMYDGGRDAQRGPVMRGPGRPDMGPDRGPADPRDARDPRGGADPRGRGPPGPPPSRPPPPPAAAPTGGGVSAQDHEKAALIMQVLKLSDEQIAMLPPDQRQSILILREQISSSGGLPS